ncbi:unnamed protein product [Gordionus sp. m RMFG-2023]|uniref:protein PALS2-like n=1 Tax=Gordionus sp. m RMFG-2023 TaxID=3053472 RepID=UPI0030E466E4
MSKVSKLNSPLDEIKYQLEGIKLKRNKDIQENDVIFLKAFAENKAINSLIKAHNTLQNEKILLPISTESLSVIDDIYEWILNNSLMKSKSQELFKDISHLFQNHYFLSLLETHDTIASKQFYNNFTNGNDQKLKNFAILENNNSKNTKYNNGYNSNIYNNKSRENTISIIDEYVHSETPMRIIGIKVYKNQPLGITIKEEDNGEFVVARIFQGGCVDKQGLLHQGDIIREMNGMPIRNMEQVNHNLKIALQNSNIENSDNSSITLKIIPNYAEKIYPAPIYVKALFDYDPKKDNLIPSKDAGLKFKDGDILEIVNKEDPNWWQARKVRICNSSSNTMSTKSTNSLSDNVSHRSSQDRTIDNSIYDDYFNNNPEDSSCAKLIPSQTLEESRKAFVKQNANIIKDYSDEILANNEIPLSSNQRLLACGAVVTKRTRKLIYRADCNNEFESCDVRVYREVSKMPPFQRKCLILVGPRGVGKAFIKQMLLNKGESCFAAPVPHTSRPRRDGEVPGITYHFELDRGKMERDIAEGTTYFESGELGGNLYGTRFDSIQRIVDSGKMCIITCNDPRRLKYLSNPTFTPYVVFVACPSVDKLRKLWKTTVSMRLSGHLKPNSKPGPPEFGDHIYIKGHVTETGNSKNGIRKGGSSSESEENSSDDDHNDERIKENTHSIQSKIYNGFNKAKLPITHNLNALMVDVDNNTGNSSPIDDSERRNSDSKKHFKVPKIPGMDSKLAPALLLSPLRNPRDSDCFDIFEESATIKQNYDHMFDLTIVNNDIWETYQIITENLEKLKTQTQWVPTDWVF